MVDLFLAEKPRQKEWLPENISGLIRLSKNEIQDDLESIMQAVQGDKYRNKRKGHGEEKKSSSGSNNISSSGSSKSSSSSSAPSLSCSSSSSGVVSKRSRLQEKIALEQKRGVAIKHQQVALRSELEAVREEIVRSRDAVMQKKRDLKTATSEKENTDTQLKILEENYRESLQASEQRRASYDKEVTELREKLAREANLSAETSTRLSELRDLHDALKDRDAEVMHLKDSLRASNRAAQMMEDAMKRFEDIPCPTSMEDSTAPVNQVVTAFIAGYSDQLVAIEQQAREAIEKLEEEGHKVKQRDTRLVELNQRFLQEQTKNTELKSKVKTQEKEMETQLTQINDLNKIIENLKNEKNASHVKYKQLEEKIKVYKDVLAVAEARASDSEITVREMFDSLHILRTGNKVLQGAYCRLLVDHLRVSPEATSKVAWPWPDSLEELKASHIQTANVIASELVRVANPMTLGDALQINSKQLEAEKAELQAELLSAREHVIRLQQELDQTQKKRRVTTTPPPLEDEEERKKDDIDTSESTLVDKGTLMSDSKSGNPAHKSPGRTGGEVTSNGEVSR